MIRDAIEKILELQTPTIKEIGGRRYSNVEMHELQSPVPEFLRISTLEGLLRYVAECDSTLKNRLKSETDDLFFVINSHYQVSLCAGVTPDFMIRPELIRATAERPAITLERYIPVEEFIIQLKTTFVPTGQVEEIIKIVGNLKSGSEVKQEDDGFTQRVTARAGAARVEEVNIPNPVFLKPYRTFLDIDQPKCPFLLRMKAGTQGVECALFESDGGMWKITARDRIHQYLADGGIPVLS